MSKNLHRSITPALGAAAGGVLTAAVVSMAVASADDAEFTPDPTTFAATQVQGYPPFIDVVTGTESWNLLNATTGLDIFPDVLKGVDTHTVMGSFTNDDFLSTLVSLNYAGTDVPLGTEIDLANFGGGWENEWIDIPGTGLNAGVSDMLITPFGDLPLMGTFFQDVL